MLADLEHQMEGVREDVTLPNPICIAAQAALMMISQYYALTDNNEVYRIAIGNLFLLALMVLFSPRHSFPAMCPDKKLEWFRSNPDWHDEDKETVK